MCALFRKDIEPRCAWCAHSRPLDEDTVSCHKRGPMPIEDHCRSFRYDPLRRTPPRPAMLRTNYSAADFALPEPVLSESTESVEETPAAITERNNKEAAVPTNEHSEEPSNKPTEETKEEAE